MAKFMMFHFESLNNNKMLWRWDVYPQSQKKPQKIIELVATVKQTTTVSEKYSKMRICGNVAKKYNGLMIYIADDLL